MRLCPGFRLAICCIYATVLSGLAAPPGMADEADPNLMAALAATEPSAPSTLQQLQMDFAQKIGGDLSQADLYLSGAGKVQLAEHASDVHLEDGETLILHAI